MGAFLSILRLASLLTGSSDPNGEQVLIKFAPLQRLSNEIEALKLCRGHESVRQLIDVIDSPQSIVLEYLHKSLYDESCERKLKRRETKRAIKAVLEGLIVLNAGKRVHTGLLGIKAFIRCWLITNHERQISNRIISSLIAMPGIPTSTTLSLVTLGIRYQKI